MKFWDKSAILAAAAICCTAGIALGAQAQGRKQSYPAHLPYSFSNFAWWSDSDLRLLLKKRIPGLGDQIATTAAAEDQIRDALTALLKQKGIDAQVMSIEPSYSDVKQPRPDLLGMDLDDSMPIAKPAIVFELVKPQVVIGNIKVDADADDALAAAEHDVQGNAGKEFTGWSLKFASYEIEKSLKQLGYFGASVDIRHSPPYRQGQRYLVDELIEVVNGPKYSIAAVVADGGPLLRGRDLSQFFTAHAGETAVPSPFVHLSPSLRSFYQENGFADVHIVTHTAVDREHANVSYALDVNPGPVYHLRTLTIEKLSRAQENRVREILGIKPGDPYREQAIMELYRAIPNEPLLKGYTFSFSPKPDRTAAAVDLTLTFEKEDGKATVTIQ
jgi:hypothetical protein